MNDIDTEITTSDLVDLQARKSAATYAEEIIEKLQSACPYNTTFIHGIPQQNKKAVEEELKRAFEIWANSWVAPLCRKIIAKANRTQP